GLGVPVAEHAPQPDDGVGTAGTETSVDNKDNHGEVAWRLRHARRGILKDVDIPDEILVGDTPPDTNVFGGGSIFGSSARLATSVFAGTAFSGQVNLLTTGTFDTPQQLFTTDNFARSIAYLSVGA